ncbi:MAG: 3'-5' exonuclease [Acidobacteria bacterium]|nr:3'-5' exonuclease [Acidobacteriota bacterium]
MFFRASPLDAPELWALDLETTGLDPRSDEVLSIGMVPIRQRVIRWGERWYQLVRPARLRRLSEESIRIHYILPEDLEQAPPIEEVLSEMADRLEEGPLLVHHQALDVAVLKRVFREHGQAWPRPKVVDTQRLLGRLDHRLRQIHPSAEPIPADLSAARATLGLPPHEEHHALYDALATAELFLALRCRLR